MPMWGVYKEKKEQLLRECYENHVCIDDVYAPFGGKFCADNANYGECTKTNNGFSDASK
jgi:hypothetical protein